MIGGQDEDSCGKAKPWTEINSGITSVSASYIQFVRFQIGLM
ncbi:hypothetical protein AAAC51_31735 [Priestia megaterium]